MTKVFSIMAILLVLVACGTTQMAKSKVKDKYVGKNISVFLDDMGPNYKASPGRDGGKSYLWSSGANYSSGIAEVECRIKAYTNSNGIVTSIEIPKDTIGNWDTSACNEVMMYK